MFFGHRAFAQNQFQFDENNSEQMNNFEDNEFRNKLKDSIEVNDGTIYIKGYSREETLFCVLYELSIIEKIKDNVYIVDNISTWENLYDKVHGKILIPNFFNYSTFLSSFSIFFFNFFITFSLFYVVLNCFLNISIHGINLCFFISFLNF